MIDENNRVIGATSSSAGSKLAFGRRETDKQLLDLFKNRTDLKKQYSETKDIVYALQAQLEESQRETQRAIDEMGALEKRLADPVAAYNAMVYFQLRQLWEKVHNKLEEFCEELKSQQRDRERKKQIMHFNQDRQKRLTEINAKIVEVKQRSDNAKKTYQAIEQKYNATSGLLNFFRRRRMRPALDQNRVEYENVRERIEALFDERIKIESEPWPDYPGLSVEGKRVINLAIIALAQHLCVHYSEHSLGTMARTAVTQRISKVDYGSKSDCEYLMNRIRDAISSMEENRKFSEELKARSKWLKSKAEYRNDKDTGPVADSIGGIPIALPGAEFGNTVAGIPLEINVIAEDYWNLSSVLIS